MAQLEQLQKILENTLTEVRRRAGSEPSETQLLAVVTERGPRYFEIDYGAPGTEGENAVLAALEEDRKVLAVFSVWSGGPRRTGRPMFCCKGRTGSLQKSWRTPCKAQIKRRALRHPAGLFCVNRGASKIYSPRLCS